jgi:DNA-binding Lrp family transcriptional regulator
MTVKAYLLIETQVGKTKQVVEAIRNIQGVASVDIVTGPYDVIAVIQTETMNDIGELIAAKLHSVAGSSRIVTCIAV